MKKNLFMSLLLFMIIGLAMPSKVDAATEIIVKDEITYKLDKDTKTASVVSSTLSEDAAIIEESVKDENNISYTTTTIGDNAFYFNNLTSVTIPEGVTSIGTYAFFYNNLTNVTIPEGVTSIGTYAFHNNQLTSVIIPEGVTTIGEDAFSSNKLTSVTIPKGISSISQSLFSSNKLTSVTIPEGITSIGKFAFSNNELTSISIPESVTTVGEYSFYMNELTSVTISKGVTTIGGYAFCYNKLPIVVIPEGVTTIGKYAFSNNELTSVSIPKSVTTIDDFAFYINKLESVTIPEGVAKLGYWAFVINQLTSITIPESLTDISEDPFIYNKIDTIYIEKYNSLDSIINVLQSNKLITYANGAEDFTSAKEKARIYALDHIEGKYTDETKKEYLLNKGEKQKLEYDSIYYAEIQTIDATSNTYNSPEGINQLIDTKKVEWYNEKNILIGTGKSIEVSKAGTYYAKVNGKYKLSNIVVKIKEEPIKKYDLTFDLNGASGITPNKQTLKVGALANKPSNPIRKGYKFNGWDTQTSGKGTTWNFKSTKMPSNNVVLYAQWKKEGKLPKTGDESIFTSLVLIVLSGIGASAYELNRKYNN